VDIPLDPSQNVPAIIRASPAGSVFRFKPGVYRLGSIIPRDGQTLVGESGAVLSGSVVLGRWRRNGGTWRARLPARALAPTGPMGPGAELGAFREDLFVDNLLYRRVASPGEIKPGTWFYDAQSHEAVLGIDPSGRTIEIGREGMAIGGDAENVSIQNLTIEKYATAPQIGAVHGHAGRNWTLTNLVVRWNHGAGLNIGQGFVVRGGRVYENGQLGIGGGSAHGATINGVEISGNNYAGYDVYWEAGGVKIAASRDVTMAGNYVHHNNGVGLWGDIDMIGTRYEGNLVVENAQSGIMHEISYHAVIEGNVVLRNGQGGRDHLTPSQILVQNSQNVRVRCNYVEVGIRVGNGITMVYDDRGRGVLGPWDTRDNIVSNNTIVHLDSGGINGFTTAFNKVVALQWPNRWENNEYVVPTISGMHWELGEGARSWKDVVGHSENGSRMLVQRRGITRDPRSVDPRAWSELPGRVAPATAGGQRRGPC
jgi:hypothetical protein